VISILLIALFSPYGFFGHIRGESLWRTDRARAIMISMRPDPWIFRFAALAIIIAGLVYGSLYPWVFSVPANGYGPLQTLLSTWAVAPGRGDLLMNIAIYIPFGYFCVRVTHSGMHASWRFGITVLAGAMLSSGVELLQYYDPGRVTSASDVYANVSGTTVGAVLGLLLRGDVHAPLIREIQSRPLPALLLTSWLGYRLYPYVPTVNIHKYWDALKPLVLHPKFTLYDSFRYTVMWLTVAALLEAILGQRRSRWILPLLAAGVIFGKIAIISHVVAPDEIVGIGAGFAIWLALLDQPARRRSLLVILPLFAFVLMWRLEPFQLGPTTRPFGWIPFYSLFHGSIEINMQTYFVKVFYYGSLVWLVAEAGLPIWVSGLVVAAFLLTVSSAEMYLPGRSAEVTDAIMALLIACLASLITSPKDDFAMEGDSRSVS
jgi:VanZ family protein